MQEGLINVVLGKIKYRISLDLKGAVFNQRDQRLSKEEALKLTGLDLADLYEVLVRILEDRSTEKKKYLDLDSFKTIIQENLAYEGFGLNRIEAGELTKGLNYAIVRTQDYGGILSLIEKIMSTHSKLKFKYVQVSYPGAKKVDFGKTTSFVRAPLGELREEGFKTIPLLAPLVCNYLIKKENAGLKSH